MNTLLKSIVWLVITAPAIYLFLIWNKLPEKIAVHYNLSGAPDRYGNKNTMLVVTALLVLVNAGIYLLLSNIHRIDPKKSAVENKDRMLRIGFAVSVFVSAVLCMIIYSGQSAALKFNVKWIFAGVGVLFSLLGNYMHNIKPNYFAGLRLPWTLENEENWRKTHLLAGKLWFAGGLVMVAVSLFLPLVSGFICFALIAMIITIIPCIYSYKLFKKMKPL